MLSFKASLFDEPLAYIRSLIDEYPGAVVYPMSYDTNRLRGIVSELIDQRKQTDSDEIFFDNIVWIASLFKEEKYIPENEYRYFVGHKTHIICKSEFYKTRVRGNQTIPYLDIPIPGWGQPNDSPVSRITAGSKTTDAQKQTLYEKAKSIGAQFRLAAG